MVLINSNPATIMTDPSMADKTYVEPIDPAVITAIIEKERPDALLPTLGGQTALNAAMALVESGALERFGVELIGASAEAIATAENRDRFKAAMQEIGLSVPSSGFAYGVDEAIDIAQGIGYPIIIRPSYILGGAGTGVASDANELRTLAAEGIAASPVGEILVERSIVGWKEFELEVMRDRNDNCVVVCSIENFDPMGVHTGDSITVAPAQTLSDVEYQLMRDAAFLVIRRIGVETGGSNIQFAVNPEDGEMVVIEMNPRVSRSSALASKATGFPIAKIAARLAVGYTLDEITNDITGSTPASFEPVIDYVVTKVPRWNFEKFPGVTGVLGTRMQSVGEAMAIGRNFPESLQKALRSMENGRAGLNCDPGESAIDALGEPELLRRVAIPTPERIFQVESLLRMGVGVERVAAHTGIDPWFLDQMMRIVDQRRELAEARDMDGVSGFTHRDWLRIKRLGFSDAQIAYAMGCDEVEVRSAREARHVVPVFKTVDTCAAEFVAHTPYLYSTFEESQAFDANEVGPSALPKVIILGAGPNRIGQGIEFDYCCVHAAFALRDAGYETIMLNCNPETVSTDYDTSDRLYFEPLTPEDLAAVISSERRSAIEGGADPDALRVIVSLGGQTPLKLAASIDPGLVAGTSPDSIDRAEDRKEWAAVCDRLRIPQPPGGTAVNVDEARAVADRVGYPVLVRPSYVLGGRAMQIVYDADDLSSAMAELAGQGTLGREGGLSAQRPVLIDRFLEDAVEVDVDAIVDSSGEVLIGGVMEHVEEAGVHSGDSACAIPPPTLSQATQDQIEDHVRAIARELEVLGPINVQFAVQRTSDEPDRVFVIEANPRASRTMPFVAKATGVPLAKIAARVMLGASLDDLRDEGLLGESSQTGHVAVKEAVLPFDRFPGVDTVLGPEMRSTGEVMGVDTTFGLAFFKSQLAAKNALPVEPGSGAVFFSLADRDKPVGLRAAARFADMGFEIVATAGTAEYLARAGVSCSWILEKVGVSDQPSESGGPKAPTALDLIEAGRISLVINTPRGRGPRADGAYIRRAAQANGIPCITTAAAALAAAQGLAEWKQQALEVRSLQQLHGSVQQRLDV